LYANQQGCDGDRLYYDGCAMIAVNGRIIAQGSQFSLTDVEVVSATIDIEDVRAHRASQRSRAHQAAEAERYHRIEAPITLSAGKFEEIHDWNRGGIGGDIERTGDQVGEVKYHKPEEEIASVSFQA
jgi:NAD+ synthase (glutamine-hydrolysing)